MATTLNKMSEQMKNNVDYIINRSYEGSNLLMPNVEIKDRKKGGYYKITCKFFGTNVQSSQPFELEPYQIEFLEINQFFVEKYTDEISLKVSLTPIQYMELFDNSRELKVLIQMFSYSINDASVNWGEKKDLDPVVSKTYRVIFKDKEDIRKSIPKSEMIPKNQGLYGSAQANQYMQAEFTLIEDLPYRLRKKCVNFQLRDATVTDILLQGCSLFGIKKISMVPADNKQVYQNVIIPPILTFDEFFQYVNSYFGVYNQGYNFYMTEEILYIYPVYDPESKSPYVTHFYNAGEHSYEGSTIFHAKDTDDNYHVVINTAVVMKNLQDDSPENIGTHFICLDADQIIDNHVSMSEADSTDKARLGLGKLNVSSLKTYLLSSGKDDVGTNFDTYSPKYIFDWNNKYTYRAILAGMRGTVAVFKWNQSVPYALKPGYRVQYHYDSETDDREQEENVSDNYRYATKSGSCFQCKYRIEPVQREGKDLVYFCVSDIHLFLGQEDLFQKQDMKKNTLANPDKGIVQKGMNATKSVGIF